MNLKSLLFETFFSYFELLNRDSKIAYEHFKQHIKNLCRRQNQKGS